MIVAERNKDQTIEIQMKTISQLQDKNNLLKFEISQLNKEKNSLKEKLKNRKENIKNVRAEVMKMKRTNDFSNINKVLAMLCAGWSEEYEDAE